MRLSIVVALYNMRREIVRTLETMSSKMQGLPAADYEIVLVDNGSTPPLVQAEMTAIAANAHVVHVLSLIHI